MIPLEQEARHAQTETVAEGLAEFEEASRETREDIGERRTTRDPVQVFGFLLGEIFVALVNCKGFF
jgi:hypothetical protein